MSAHAISPSLIQLMLIAGAIASLVVAWLGYRRVVTRPLARMASDLEAVQRQLEEQKRRLREKIEELERANADLDQLAVLKDDFLATINHQLRTPVTSMVECIELIRDGALGPLTPDQTVFVHTMEQNAMRLAHLIEEVLDISLLKSSRRLLQVQPSDLAAVLSASQAAWEAALRPTTIRLACEALPPVFMDAQAIREVMDHLLRNAQRHAPRGSQVHLEARALDGVVEVRVRDQGPGIAPEQLAQLFEPFTHIQRPEAPGSQGSGLGLAFCRQVIERHRGTIRADSMMGQGMTITYTLPIASTQFLFEEACRETQEEMELEEGQFGLLLVCPNGDGAGEQRRSPEAVELMRRAEVALRRHTHRGDRFVRLDDDTLVIIAGTDRPGLEAMTARLRGLLGAAQLDVQLTHVLFPEDGQTPEQLLDAAHSRSSRRPSAAHATMGLSRASSADRSQGGR